PLYVSPAAGAGGSALPGRSSASARARIPEAPRAAQMAGIKAVAQVRVCDRLSRARRVNESPLTGVDADVVHATGANMEKHEISGGQLRQRHRARGAPLRDRRTR